ncbi:MAG: hypothetical protein JW795_10745 [Chitinivibrionales bacterium]|nr:hypothetical protein [Chitinivibrionales bacterium]
MNQSEKETMHQWCFFSSGGLDQVKISCGADMANLHTLDKKLWVALSCPTRNLNIDSTTLEYIDSDKDNRIRAQELIAVTRWICSLLKNCDDLLKKDSSIPLASLADTTAEGRTFIASVKQILLTLGKPDADQISIDDTVVALKRFYETDFNGDGIIVADAVTDQDLRSVLSDIVTCIGSQLDRSGKPGVNSAAIERFFTQAQAFLAWSDEAAADPSIVPLGENTAAGWAAFSAVQSKIDDYFIRCKIAAFDDRAGPLLNRDEAELGRIAAKNLTLADPDIRSLPLYRVQAGQALSLLTDTNPAWSEALRQLHDLVVKPLLGSKPTLTEAEWQSIVKKMEPYAAWQSRHAGDSVASLGAARVRQICTAQNQEALMALVAKDLEREKFVEQIICVDTFLHYYRDLYKLCTNFVNFKAFYSPNDKAIFQAGTLFMDQRSCELCLIVDDAAKHAAVAALAGTCLAYCDCVRKGSNEKIQIVAAFTDGDSDNLMVGRNGVFYDYKGVDWDATITRIIENPISIRQAFWSPYKSFVRMIETQIAKRAAAADAESATKMESAAKNVAHADKSKAPETKKIDVGSVAALGVALGALGTFVATILGYLTGIFKLGVLPAVGAIVSLVIAISGPSMILAYIKLRKRNLGPILDGNGWAINARAKITVSLGSLLTAVSKLPKGSKRDLFDPFADKKSIWPKIVVAAVILYLCYLIMNYTGMLYEVSGHRIGKNKNFSFQKFVPQSPGQIQDKKQ